MIQSNNMEHDHDDGSVELEKRKRCTQRKEEKRRGMHYANRIIPLGKVSSWPNHRLHSKLDFFTLWSKIEKKTGKNSHLINHFLMKEGVE